MIRQHAYLGTYTDGESEGIYRYDLRVTDDQVRMRPRDVTELGENPSYLAVHPSGETIYAVHEVEDGSVTAFDRAPDGSLNRLNSVSSGASGPCHCSVHPSGEYLFVAHYTGGAISVVGLRADGSLGERLAVVSHAGSSVTERQDRAHPHSIVPGPNGKYVYVCDFGTDEIVVYDLNGGDLTRNDAVSVRAGSGPRHLAFHPSAEYVYVINELDSTLSAFAWASTTGALEAIGTVSTVPADHSGTNLAADVHVHPSGEWVFGTNRGHDSVSVFAVDPASGAIETVGFHETRGKWPRNFAFDTTGSVLFAQNRETETVVGFRVDEQAGTLEPSDLVLDVPTPACMTCLPASAD